MRIHDNYEGVNAESAVKTPNSIYHTWRKVLEKRKEFKDIFVYGDFGLLDESNEKIFAYIRRSANIGAGMIVVNFSEDFVSWEWAGTAKQIIVSTGNKQIIDVNAGKIELDPYEAIALLL